MLDWSWYSGRLFVGVATGEYARRADFYDHLNELDKPAGTICGTVHGQSPAKGRNDLIKMAHDHECTHIFIVDDDMIIPSDAAYKLLLHDKDVVSGLYLMRTFPHYPVILDRRFHDGQCKFMFLTPDKSGLIEVVNCGFGCVMIDIRVFNDLKQPYVTLGEIIKDEWCDDIVFFNKVCQAGYKIFCDTDVRVGHMHSVTIEPQQDENGNWQVAYKSAQGAVAFPAIVPDGEELNRQIKEHYEKQENSLKLGPIEVPVGY